VDIEHLSILEDLFGLVPSDMAVFHAFHKFDAAQRGESSQPIVEVWAKLNTKPSYSMILDFDASLVDIHSEVKRQPATTYEMAWGLTLPSFSRT
jgi:hypothetical protein